MCVWLGVCVCGWVGGCVWVGVEIGVGRWVDVDVCVCFSQKYWSRPPNREGSWKMSSWVV